MSVSNTLWARPANTSIVKYLRREEVDVLRKFPTLSKILDGGRIVKNASGLGIRWEVQYRNHTVQGNTGADAFVFTPTNLHKYALIPYRGYKVSDAITEKERLENRGQEALIRVVEGMAKRLKRSIQQGLGPEVYKDGGAHNSSGTDWHGIESMMGYSQTLDLSATSIGGRSANAADLVAYPDDNYAGLDTDLAGYSGSYQTTSVGSGTSLPQAISTHWPNGQATPDFDFWSPLIINYTSSSFNGTADTWAAQGAEAMRFGITQCSRNAHAKDLMVDTIVLDRDLYNQYVNSQDNKERVIVSSSEPGKRQFGFDIVTIDGCELYHDYGVPAGCGYGFNTSLMELHSMYGDLFDVDGPVYDENTQTHKFWARTLSNLAFESPRNFFKLKNIA